VLASSRSELRLTGRRILERDGERMVLGFLGWCRRGQTLRDSRGKLIAVALPARGGGYRVSVGRGERLWIGRRRESFFRWPMVVERKGAVVVRFDGSTVNELGSSLPVPVLAFLVHLHKVMCDAEAAAAAVVAVC
jgi:hypothetical protein